MDSRPGGFEPPASTVPPRADEVEGGLGIEPRSPGSQPGDFTISRSSLEDAPAGIEPAALALGGPSRSNIEAEVAAPGFEPDTLGL
jgi:hypothetical protein